MNKRLLFISPEFPYPAYSGGVLRTLSILRCLAERFDVHCVTFAQGEPDRGSAKALRAIVKKLTVLPLQVHRRTATHRLTRNLGRAMRFVPPLVDRFAEPQIQNALVPLLADARDWVWFEHLWLAPYVANVSKGAAKVLDVHNVESDYYKQMRRGAGGVAKRCGHLVFEKAAFKVEQLYLDRFDRVLAVSEDDRQKLSENCSREKILIVPNSVPLPPLAAEEASAGKTLFFAGRIDYPPNGEGIAWFFHKVWPKVRRRVPDLKWIIVGDHSDLLEPALKRDERIFRAGQVEDVNSYLRSSSIAIVPILVGGGTRFKILEAWAAGKPVISTTKGAAGLDWIHKENIWIADTPEQFAEAVVNLLQDSKLRTTLGRNGWDSVRKLYSTDRLTERLAAILRDRSG